MVMMMMMMMMVMMMKLMMMKVVTSRPQSKSSQIVPEYTVELRGATVSWAAKDKSSKRNVLEVGHPLPWLRTARYRW